MGAFLPCSKTWLGDVRIITNDKVFFRGRFRGRLIKVDAHRPFRCVGYWTGIVFTLTRCTLHCCLLPHLQGLLLRTSKRFRGPALQCQGLFLSYWISFLARLEVKLTFRQHQPILLVSHYGEELCSWSQIGKCGLKCSSVVETWSETVPAVLPGWEKSRD